ncbi:MAG: MarR family transcriptional regulator [Anaerolineaceae bacterium]|nr:MarR family transcriptional regulator [Anaerolineaceae bacterium]
MEESSERTKLIEAVNEATRQQSTWTVMFHAAVANEIGLNITDHKCLDILLHQGPITAGKLAELTGLTTGAVTGVIDRLENAGYLRRERDPNDRRRVILQPLLDKAGEAMGPVFEHFQERFIPTLERYDDETLRRVLEFVGESIRFMQAEIQWLRNKNKP